MKLNKREEFLLWKLLEFAIHRYLLTLVRHCGAERAERHIEMSKTIWEAQNCRKADPAKFREWMEIHDTMADKLTDDLYKHIGLDLDLEDNEHDWDILTDKFFKKLLEIFFTQNPKL
jgi:hypothetical protein